MAALIRILSNALIMVAEIAAVAAIAWVGYHHPFLFAGLTAGLSFVLGLGLEMARLRNELPFYFDRPAGYRFVLVPFVGFVEALMKAVLAGVAALFTFSGTDTGRLYWVAMVFAIVVFAGSSLLRVLSMRFNAHPARWGYFRLGTPLGLLFSAGLAVLAALALIPASSLSDIGWKIIWDMPAKPSLDQVSELVFQIKQAFDDFVVTILATVMERDWAKVAGVFVSVNVLAGFVASLYASIIATAVRWGEGRLYP